MQHLQGGQVGALQLANNLITTTNSKHMDIRNHDVRESSLSACRTSGVPISNHNAAQVACCLNLWFGLVAGCLPRTLILRLVLRGYFSRTEVFFVLGFWRKPHSICVPRFTGGHCFVGVCEMFRASRRKERR